MKRIVGNIGALPLPDGKFAFGRVLVHSNVEFYRHIDISEDILPADREVWFTVCCHASFFRHMTLVGKLSFADEKSYCPI